MEETLKLILDKLNSMDSDIKGLKKDVIRIENNHGAKLDSLMDGYGQLMDGYKRLYEGQEEIKNTLNRHEVKLLKVK